MKPKYHALFLVILHRTSSVSLSCHHIASTLTSSAANSIVLYSSLFHHSLSYRQESVLLARKAAKNSPVIESILCKPISDPSFRTNPPLSPRFPLSHLSSSYYPPPSVLPFTEPDMPSKESIVYSRISFLSLSPPPLAHLRYRSVCKY